MTFGFPNRNPKKNSFHGNYMRKYGKQSLEKMNWRKDPMNELKVKTETIKCRISEQSQYNF